MSGFTSKDVSHIERLKGIINFQVWKFQISLTLKSHELMDLVMGTDVEPSPTVTAGVTTNLAAIKAWRQRDNTAQLYISSSINPDLQNSFITSQSAAQMWQRVVSQFEQTASENKLFLLQQFLNYQYKEGHDIVSHITTLEVMANQLNDIGSPVSDDQIITKVASTLPPSYRHVIAAWENLDDNRKTLNLLRVRLMKQETMNQQGADGDSSDAAFFARRTERRVGGGATSANRDRAEADRKCDYCGKKNHEESRCWKKKKDIRQREETSNANVASSGGDWPHGYAFITFSLLSQVRGGGSRDWYADSGASQHMSDQRWMFSSYTEVPPGTWPVKGIGLDNAPLQVHGVGHIPIRSRVDGVWIDAVIKDAVYVPSLGANLFSIRCATKLGAVCIFTGRRLSIAIGEKIVAVGACQSSLYRLDIEPSRAEKGMQSTVAQMARVVAQPISTWHHRLGHVSTKVIREMEAMKMVEDLVISPGSDPEGVCPGCAYGKLHRLPFPTGGRTRGQNVGDLIHSDVCGPMSKTSPGGARFFVCFKDDYSGYCIVRFMKKKSEVQELFQHFVALVHTETGREIKTLRSDNGGEYMSSEFQNWLKKKGIRHETSVAKTPQQNGVAERQFRTITEKARCMLHSSGLSTDLWAEATNTAVYILNRVYSKTALEKKTPYEMWHQKKPNMSHVRVFGSIAYAHVPSDERGKFDPTGIRCIHVGYCETQKAFRLWDPVARRVRISRDVLFEEKTPFPLVEDPDIESERVVRVPVVAEDSDPSEEDSDPFEDSVVELPVSTTKDAEEEKAGSEKPNATQPREKEKPVPHQPIRVSTRIGRGRPALSWAEESQLPTYAGLAAVGDTIEEPRTYREAIESPQVSHWSVAMEEEMDSLKKNEVWDLMELPVGKKVIQSRWVFSLKRDSDGAVQRFKARLVAKGFTQRAGLDYEETYSPVVRHDSIRTVIALAAAMDLEIAQLDVKTAFLYGDLKEELYIAQPAGFILQDKEHLVCRLNRSLYGLKQASRAWNSKFNDFITKYGLTRSTADPCVYFQQTETVIVIMVIWVDDALVFSNQKSHLDDIVHYLGRQFEMTSGKAGCFVGIQITRDRENKLISLHQEAYIKRILSNFGMGDCNPRKVPADPHARLSKRSCDEEEYLCPYREAVGSLMYAMTCTRPDIAFSVSQVAQFCSSPSRSHWEAVKRVFSYLNGTQRYGLTFGTSSEGRLVAYTDADFAGNLDDRRSTSGSVLTLNGGPIAWASRLQKCTALSTTEAEYVAASSTAKDVIWLRQLLGDIGHRQNKPTPVWCDNQSAVRLVRNPEYHQRTKHIDVKYHHIRGLQEAGVIDVGHIRTAEQLADPFTKGLEAGRFNYLISSFGLVNSV